MCSTFPNCYKSYLSQYFSLLLLCTQQVFDKIVLSVLLTAAASLHSEHTSALSYLFNVRGARTSNFPYYLRKIIAKIDDFCIAHMSQSLKTPFAASLLLNDFCYITLIVLNSRTTDCCSFLAVRTLVQRSFDSYLKRADSRLVERAHAFIWSFIFRYINLF